LHFRPLFELGPELMLAAYFLHLGRKRVQTIDIVGDTWVILQEQPLCCHPAGQRLLWKAFHGGSPLAGNASVIPEEDSFHHHHEHPPAKRDRLDELIDSIAASTRDLRPERGRGRGRGRGGSGPGQPMGRKRRRNSTDRALVDRIYGGVSASLPSIIETKKVEKKEGRVVNRKRERLIMASSIECARGRAVETALVLENAINRLASAPAWLMSWFYDGKFQCWKGATSAPRGIRFQLDQVAEKHRAYLQTRREDRRQREEERRKQRIDQ
jgi:hypothetical protein